MKAYLKRAAMSCAALFLLLVLVAPVMTASDPMISGAIEQPSNHENPEPTKIIPPMPEYEYLDAVPDTQQNPLPETVAAPEPEEISVDMAVEEEEPAAPDPSDPLETSPKGKSDPQGHGFLKNLLKKIK